MSFLQFMGSAPKILSLKKILLNYATTWIQHKIQTGAGNAGEQFIRRVRSILNKLTPENFQKLTQEVANQDLQHKSSLKQIVALIFEKGKLLIFREDLHKKSLY